MEVRTPMCEGEIILGQGAVSMAGILRDSISLPSHAPIKTRATRPRAIMIPRHLREGIERPKTRYNNSLTYACNDVSIVIYIFSGFRPTMGLGCARNNAGLWSSQILQMGTYLELTEAVQPTVVLVMSRGNLTSKRTNPNVTRLMYLTAAKSALFKVSPASLFQMYFVSESRVVR
jgi:hypothetical protein